ncbi:MAG: ferrochelatase, partial [Gemmatimonadota bacterium]
MRRTPAQDETEVLLLGFGEPDGASPGETLAYLERIFLANARLDGEMSADARRRRCRDLAERRAPGLQADYERIGGSPLLAQCRAQAQALEAELTRRGASAPVRIAMQFTDPAIDDVVNEVVAAGARRLVALPLYPLCGASTTIAALDSLHAALERAGGASVEVVDVTGWHAHPGYVDAVGDAAEKALVRATASLEDPGTLLYFSAHGTPVKYLEEGSRYDRYVEEACSLVAARLGTERYVIGYQNHSNRGVPWT